ncbi:MAG: endolytic transglycosylase MltG [Pontibacterium sp.]
MKKALLIIVFVFTLIGLAVAAGGYFIYQQFLTTPNQNTQAYVLDIKPGMSFNKITQTLVDEGVVSNVHLFKVYARLEGIATRVKAGEAAFEPGLTPTDVASLLISNQRVEYSVTIVEGMTFKELLAKLKTVTNINHTLTPEAQQSLLSELKVNQGHPEGLFLAETYRYRKGENDVDILRRANRLLASYLDEQWQERQKGLPYKSAYEALIMASIIEKETGRPDERPEIAGVFVRRLEKKMRLQTDPTVIYGMGDSYKGNIRRKDLRTATPYNTYVIPALPPTPIAMVGREAINAAFNPKDGKALYFVAKGDGSHYFSATLAEHNKAVREYQLKRSKNYRSSP